MDQHITTLGANEFRRFFRLTKVDEAKRLVYGTMAEEVGDQADEIMDYGWSKPHFQAWSAKFSKATDGASVGNVREMHQPISAGRLETIEFDDDAKKIDACAYVGNDDTWGKVQKRMLTGFSIGGKYGRKEKYGNLTRYEAIPSEVSLVDHPCLPTATFTMIKADGTTQELGFTKIAQREDVSPEDQKKIDAAIGRAKKKFGIGDAKKYIGEAIDEFHDLGLHKAAAPLEASVGKWALRGFKKGLYGVALLAQVLEALNDQARMAEYEAQAEGDGSKIPDRLKAVRDKLGGVLVDMTEEEVDELNPPEGEGTMENSEKIAKALALIAEVHGAAALGKAVTGSEHKGMVQEIHDHAAALGAGHNHVHDDELKKDGYGLPETGDKATSKAGNHTADEDKSEKMAAMNASLQKALERIAVLEKQPAAPTGASPAVVAMSKGDDTAANREAQAKKAAEDEAFAKMSPQQQALILIKKAQNEGRVLSTDDMMKGDFGFKGARVLN